MDGFKEEEKTDHGRKQTDKTRADSDRILVFCLSVCVCFVCPVIWICHR